MLKREKELRMEIRGAVEWGGPVRTEPGALIADGKKLER